MIATEKFKRGDRVQLNDEARRRAGLVGRGLGATGTVTGFPGTCPSCGRDKGDLKRVFIKVDSSGAVVLYHMDYWDLAT